MAQEFKIYTHYHDSFFIIFKIFVFHVSFISCETVLIIPFFHSYVELEKTFIVNRS